MVDHQHDPAVLPAGDSGAGIGRRHQATGVLTVADRLDLLVGQVGTIQQIGADRVGAALAELEVVLRRAGCVGEALDRDESIRIVLVRHGAEPVENRMVLVAHRRVVEREVDRHVEPKLVLELLDRYLEVALHLLEVRLEGRHAALDGRDTPTELVGDRPVAALHLLHHLFAQRLEAGVHLLRAHRRAGGEAHQAHHGDHLFREHCFELP